MTEISQNTDNVVPIDRYSRWHHESSGDPILPLIGIMADRLRDDLAGRGRTALATATERVAASQIILNCMKIALSKTGCDSSTFLRLTLEGESPKHLTKMNAGDCANLREGDCFVALDDKRSVEIAGMIGNLGNLLHEGQFDRLLEIAVTYVNGRTEPVTLA